MTYVAKANQIILDSIKSAIFIDEKARPFFSSESGDNHYEEKLSVELFKNFKSNGISLAIHKFEIENEDSSLKNYLFDNRDLVLLDWRLDGNDGEEHALKMLSNVVKSPHIHFCVIYTSEPDVDNVFVNISTFFSSKNSTFYDKLLTELDAYEEEIRPIVNQFSLLDDSQNSHLVKRIKDIDPDFLKTLKGLTGINSPIKAFKHVAIAFSSFHKSEVDLNYPLLFSVENNTIVINNTIVTIINKDKNENANSDASSFIMRFANQIIKSKNSYTQLLGLEMQSLFSKNSSFIDSNFINVSKETVAYHRKQLMNGKEDDTSFRKMMKRVFLEHANQHLNPISLNILSADLMMDINTEEVPNDDELASMNVFYNSVKLSTENKKLNFGDVFQSEKGEFYICITALCDCLRPFKNDYRFYFAKGQKMKTKLALKLGDTAFISFISAEIAIVWSNIDKVKEITDDEVEEKIFNIDNELEEEIIVDLVIEENGEEEEKEAEELREEELLLMQLQKEKLELEQEKTELEKSKKKIEKEKIKLQMEKAELEQFRYKPIYVKPRLFLVKDPLFNQGEIELTRVFQLKKNEEKLEFKSLKYITTIKTDYAQRIANHAFSHPVRVGVDFVKKN